MNNYSHRLIVAMTIFLSCFFPISHAQNAELYGGQPITDFQWPEGKKMGLSLTFDDARLSQIDNGIPLLDKYGVKATFYVTPCTMFKRLDGWKKAVNNGHEIGNHTICHSCSANYGWPQECALENYTLTKMSAELDSANKIIKDKLEINVVSFAYPCGQTFVGSGRRWP